MSLADRAVRIMEPGEDVARMIEELAETLPAYPGKDREELRDALGSNSPTSELRAVESLARNNPGAWALLRRFIARQSRFVADRVRGIGPDKNPEQAYAYIMHSTGGASSLASLSAELDPARLRKRLDKLASDDDNGRLEDDESERNRERTGARWVSVPG